MNRCGHIKDDGKPCRARVKDGATHCRWHQPDDEAVDSIAEQKKEASRVADGKSSTMTLEEAKRVLSSIADGSLTETKTTSTGETYEAAPSAKDRKDAILALDKLEGWSERDASGDNNYIRVVTYLPSRRG